MRKSILIILVLLLAVSCAACNDYEKGFAAGYKDGFNSGYMEGVGDAEDLTYDDGYLDGFHDANTGAARTVPSLYDGRDVEWIETPKSTCFSYIGYDSENEILVVVFRESCKVYYYEEFSRSNMDTFKAQYSLGGYYNKYIKGYYPCTKVQPGQMVNLPEGADP